MTIVAESKNEADDRNVYRLKWQQWRELPRKKKEELAIERFAQRIDLIRRGLIMDTAEYPHCANIRFSSYDGILYMEYDVIDRPFMIETVGIGIGVMRP